MRISDWSSDVCSSDLFPSHDTPHIEKYLEVAVTLLFLLGVAGFMAIKWLK